LKDDINISVGDEVEEEDEEGVHVNSMWVLDCYGRINLRSRPYQNDFGMAWCLEERHCNPQVENFTTINWIVGNIKKCW
jgi:hypothetical protein